MSPTDLIAVSAIVVGFSITAIMFRIQRELYVLETLNIGALWLAWADYLIVASVILAVFGGTVPLLLWPTPSNFLTALAAASCAGALVLQAGYIPSILAHYRIQLGAGRKGPRAKGEPIERLFVIGSSLIASFVFAATFLLHLAR
ncbi:MAG TPA: hypothetical protein VGH13_19070 [Xanthobacteraceae bacterium]|jgi:hypothetical protein